MLNAAENLKYSRHLSLPEIGEVGQMKLKQSSVIVVGAGGLGCPLLQYLAAAGVGKIHIVDSDSVDASNLQRQVLYREEDIEKPKAEAAATRLRAQNSLIQIYSHNLRLSADNILSLFRSADIVIDCSDNLSTRYLISDAATILGKPVVYGAVDRFQGQVSVFNLHNGAPTYRCLFPESRSAAQALNCSETGVLGVLPGIIGVIQATEVIKIICGFGEVLSGKILLFDARTMQFSTIGLERNAETGQEQPATEAELMQSNYYIQCSNNQYAISSAELQDALQLEQEFTFIDIREDGELPEISELLGLRIPFSMLESKVAEIDRNSKVVLYCKSGVRSSKALGILTEKYGLLNCMQLIGGVDAWLQFKESKTTSK